MTEEIDLNDLQRALQVVDNVGAEYSAGTVDEPAYRKALYDNDAVIIEAARAYRAAKKDLAEANNLIEHLTDSLRKKGLEQQLLRMQMAPLVSAMGIAIPMAIKHAEKKGLQANKDQLLRAEILLRAIPQEPQGKA